MGLKLGIHSYIHARKRLKIHYQILLDFQLRILGPGTEKTIVGV